MADDGETDDDTPPTVYDLIEVVPAEREFLDASVAVWREIDRISATGTYLGIASGEPLRKRERAAWERYRDEVLDA